MTKLWKIEVNNWGWDNPRTLYAKSREEAEKISKKFPAGGDVKYAGAFDNAKAEKLVKYTEQTLDPNGFWGVDLDD